MSRQQTFLAFGVILVALLAALAWFYRPDPVASGTAPATANAASPLAAQPGTSPATSPGQPPSTSTSPGATKKISTSRTQRPAHPRQSIAPPAPAAAPAADALPEFSTAEIKKQIQSQIPAVKACYERLLAVHPDAEGKLVAHLTLGDAGDADHAYVITDVSMDPSEGMTDQDLTDCVTDALYDVAMAPDGSGGPVEISWPFVFAQAHP